MIERITDPTGPPPQGPYSHAVKAGGFIYVSGQASIDASTGQFVSESVAGETRRTIGNVQAILRAAGADLGDVVKCSVFLSDIRGEGGTELFKTKYFEKEVFLAQSPQLYKQMIACAMENMVTITPVWRAEKAATASELGYIFDGNAGGLGDEGQFSMLFGTDEGNPTSANTNAEAELTVAGGAGLGKDVDLSGEWEETGAGTLPPDTSEGSGLPRTMSVVTCGQEGSLPLQPQDFYAVGANFDITLPVGGTIIPIDTTALLLAGISSSALWLVPLVALAGGTFAVLRYQVNKK